MEKEKKILIIKAAIKRFIRHGKHKTTLDEIARDLRMSKSSLYHYFSSKDTLYNESLKFELDSYLLDINNIFNSEIEILDKLTEYLNLKIDFINKYKLAYDLLVLFLNKQCNEVELELLGGVFKEEELLLKKHLKKHIPKNELNTINLPAFLLYQTWGLIISYNLQQINNPAVNNSFKDLLKNQLEILLK